jgi:hypothetical protein
MVTSMDTLFVGTKNFSKAIISTINVSIIFGLLISQNVFSGKPIFADEALKLANGAMISPIFQGTELDKNITEKLSFEQRKENFDKLDVLRASQVL